MRRLPRSVMSSQRTFGRSLFLVPLQKRRLQLMEIDWVEDATVSKVWPDTMKIVVKGAPAGGFCAAAAPASRFHLAPGVD